jgi:alpha-2-macroglobulin
MRKAAIIAVCLLMLATQALASMPIIEDIAYYEHSSYLQSPALPSNTRVVAPNEPVSLSFYGNYENARIELFRLDSLSSSTVSLVADKSWNLKGKARTQTRVKESYYDEAKGQWNREYEEYTEYWLNENIKVRLKPGIYAVTLNGVLDTKLVVTSIHGLAKFSDSKVLVTLSKTPATLHFMQGSTILHSEEISGHYYGPDHAASMLLAEAGGEVYPFFGHTGKYYGAQAIKAHIYTDRPVYRPNQTVNFRGIFWKLTPEKMLIESSYATVSIRDSRYTEIYSSRAAVDPWGAITGQLELPDNASTGSYQIEIQIEGSSQYASFMVEEYRKPEFELEVNPELEFAVEGQEIKIELDAQYYFGEPVKLADISYEVYQSYYRPPCFGYFRCHYDSYYYPGYGGIGTLILEASTKTDAEGKASFSFLPNATGFAQRFFVVAKATDKSRKQVEKTASITVVPSLVNLNIESDRYSYRKGDEVRLQLLASTYQGEPLSVPVRIQINSSHPLTREFRTRIVDSTLTITNGESEFSFRADDNGRYIIKVSGEDESGKAFEVQRFLWVYGQGEAFTQMLELDTDKDFYQPGDTAKLFLLSPIPSADVLITIEGPTLHKVEQVHIEGYVKVIEIPITEAHQPNIFVSAVIVTDDAVFMTTAELGIVPDMKFLNVSIATDKEQYSAGDTARYYINLQNSEGKGEHGVFSFGLVDEPIYDIYPDSSGDLFFDMNERNENFVLSYGLIPQSSPVRTVVTQKRIREFHPQPPMPYYWRGRAHYSSGPSNVWIFVVAAIAFAGLLASIIVLGIKGHNMAMGLLICLLVFVVFFTSCSLLIQNTSRSSIALDMAMDAISAPVAGKAREEAYAAGGQLVQPEIRKYFPDSAAWVPAKETDGFGNAVVDVKLPDSLTTWRATVKAHTKDMKSGQAINKVIVRKDVIARLAAPRFLTQGDKVILSGVAHNYLETEKQVTFSAATSEDVGLLTQNNVELYVPSGQDKRVDFTFEVLGNKVANITFFALTDEESDAVQHSLPIVPYGVFEQDYELKRLDAAEEFVIDVGKPIDPQASRFELVLSSTLAKSLLDSLEYLSQYPYGCVEQTINRFLPSLGVVSAIEELGLQENGLLSQTEGHVNAGLQRLYEMQNPDGSFGWWWRTNADPYMSAYALLGLTVAREHGFGVDYRRFNNLQAAVASQLEKISDKNQLAFSLYAYTLNKQVDAKTLPGPDQLNSYGKALLSLTYINLNMQSKARQFAEQLELEANCDELHCYWDTSGERNWWRYNDMEATAWALKALVASKPDSEQIPRAVAWLMSKKQARAWTSTKDTGIAVLALADYLKHTGELNPEFSFQVYQDGKLVKQGAVNALNALSFNGSILLDVVPKTRVRVEKQGQGSLYLYKALNYLARPPRLTERNEGLKVTREYSKATLEAGEVFEVTLTIESDRDYEYVHVQDYLPSGCEFVKYYEQENRHYYSSEHMDVRDEKLDIFFTTLPKGVKELKYRLRSEFPGELSAMPATAQMMYAPQVNGHSAQNDILVAQARV